MVGTTTRETPAYKFDYAGRTIVMKLSAPIGTMNVGNVTYYLFTGYRWRMKTKSFATKPTKASCTEYERIIFKYELT